MSLHPDSTFAADVQVVVRAAEGGAFDEPTRTFHVRWAELRSKALRPFGDATTGELKNAWKQALWEIAAGLLGCDLLYAKAVMDYCVSAGIVALFPAARGTNSSGPR